MTTLNQARSPKASWMVFFGLSLLLVLSSLYLVFSGVDQVEFQASTGGAWESFLASEPGVAAYLLGTLQLLGIGYLGSALFGAVMSLTGFRKGQKSAWYTMWVFPIIYGVTAGVMFVSQSPIGYFYGAFSVIGLVTLVFSYRTFFQKD